MTSATARFPSMVPVLENPLRNIGPKKTNFTHFKEWAGSGKGIPTILSVLQKTAKLASLMFDGVNDFMKHYCKKAATVLGQGLAVLVLPRLPEVTQDAVSSVKGLQGNVNRLQINRAVQDVAEATASVGYAASLATSFSDATAHLSKTLASWMQWPDLIKNTAEAVEIAGNWHLCRSALDQVPVQRGVSESLRKELSDNLTFSMRAHLIKLTKVVTSVALGAIALFGFSFAPKILATAALTGALFGVAAHFYKVTNPNYKVVEATDLIYKRSAVAV